MQVRDVMRPSSELLSIHATAQAAADRMKREDVGCLVVGDKSHAMGLVTDRDLLVRCMADGKDPSSTPVRDVMSVGVVHCREDETVGNVIERMMDQGMLRLPVLDRKGQMVGIVSARESVRSVPMSRVSQNRPNQVHFFKEIPTCRGEVHQVSLQSIYVTAAADDEQAEHEAVERFQADHGLNDWRLLADGFKIERAA